MKCLRCGHEWKPIVKEPKQCPKCKMYYYNKPREWVKQIDNTKSNDVIVIDEAKPKEVDLE